MTTLNSTFLRRVIGVDAAGGLAGGLLFALGGRPLAELTGLPTSLSLPVGLFMLAWGGLLTWIVTRPALNRTAVWTVVGVNLLWVVESVLLLAMHWVQPTGVGYALVIGQAGAVAILADLQFLGLRRAPALS